MWLRLEGTDNPAAIIYDSEYAAQSTLGKWNGKKNRDCIRVNRELFEVFVVGKRCDSPPTPATSGFPEGVRPPPAAAPRGIAEGGVALPTAASSGVTGRTFAVLPAAATGSVVTGKRCGSPPTPATSGVGERTGLPPARTYPPSEGTRTAANAAINVVRRPR